MMRKGALWLAVGNRRTLALIAALLVGTATLFGLGVRTAETQTTLPAETTYEVQDLGTLGGGNKSGAYGINDSGQAVGWSSTSSGARHAFLKDGDQPMQDLGTLDGDDTSAARGINASGQVVGHSSFFDDEAEDDVYSAFLKEGDQPMQDLGTLGGDQSDALGINDSGQVVGTSYTSSNERRAYLKEGDQPMQDLDTLGGGESGANGINASGQVVGHSSTSSGQTHAFLYSDGQMQDLDTLGGDESGANGINASGQVVGHSSTSSGERRAFLKEGDQLMQDLGTLGGTQSNAHGVNDSGQVVGHSDTSGGETHAFLYSEGQMTDLNTLIPADSGWTLVEARAINSDGQIAATGYKAEGEFRALLLTSSGPTTPVDSVSKEVPANGTVSTGSDGSASPASASDPVNTTITSPIAGNVSIAEKTYDPSTGQQPIVDGIYTFFGQQIDITVPGASTWDKPYKFEFVVDSSLLNGTSSQDIEVFRNGALVADCAPAAAGKASPDPCIVNPVEQLDDGDIKITVYTSNASSWNIGSKKTFAAKITCGTKSDRNKNRVICKGTENGDQILERKGSRKEDDIRALGGDDTIKVTRAGRDADTVLAQPGNDTVLANDGDTRDKIDCGQGTDEAKIDVKSDTSGNITASDQVSPDCETVRDQDGNPVLLTALPETAVVDMADNPS